ncbi:MAG TPA: hypothetical protein VJ802_03785 [Gemmatimonadaceae bacterium]|nr:hypothetical protein [Gemmatimonadaceae bacterium]
MSNQILQLLTTFYDAGRVPCAGASPLHIAFDPHADQVRLWADGVAAHNVVFPETKFVEMVRRSGIPPTASLVRVWLGTVYFDPHVYPWVRTE